MGVQKVILKRNPQVTASYTKPDGSVGTTVLNGETGCLALGVPGNIYDASPARIHTAKLGSDAEIGDFVEGQGIIVNAREYALVGGTNPATGTHEALYPSLILSGGDAASFMTFGHVVVKCKNVSNIFTKMDGIPLAGYNKDEAKAVCTDAVAKTITMVRDLPPVSSFDTPADGDIGQDNGVAKKYVLSTTSWTEISFSSAADYDPDGSYSKGDPLYFWGDSLCVIEVNGIQAS